jgi:acyl-CoA synthetase (AMP-forming)/AMP-acid ligase II
MSAARAAARDALGLDLDAIVLIEPRSIPRTTSGKIRRSRCRELFLGDELDVVAEWDAAEGGA